MWNKVIKILPIIISAICLYLTFSGVSLKGVISSFSNIKWHFLFFSFLLWVFSFILRIIRWKFFFKNKIKFYSLLSSFLIGLMVNNLFPARIGELVRVYVLGKKENISKSLVFATILLERTLDGLSVFLFLAILIFFCDFPKEVKTMGFIITIVYLTAIVFFFFLKFHKDFVVKYLSFSKRLVFIILEFSEGLACLGSLKTFFIISLYSIISWIIVAFSFYVCLFGFSINLPIYSGFFILVMCAIGVMIPAAPGYLGTYQYFCILSLMIFKVEKDIAFSYSIITYIISFIPVTIAGIIFLLKERILFSKILSLRKEKVIIP